MEATEAVAPSVAAQEQIDSAANQHHEQVESGAAAGLKPEPEPTALAACSSTRSGSSSPTQATALDLPKVSRGPTRSAPAPRVDPSVNLVWKTRYDALVQTNQRLQQQIQELQRSTTRMRVNQHKLVPTQSLPHPDSHSRAREAFVGELLVENHDLLTKLRASELRIARLSGKTRSLQEPAALGALQGAGQNEKSHEKPTSAGHDAGTQTDPSPGHQHHQQHEHEPSRHDEEHHPMQKQLEQQLQQLELDLQRLQQENDLLRHDPVTCTQEDTTIHALPLTVQLQLDGALQQSLQRLTTLEIRYAKLQQTLQDQMTRFQAQVAQNDHHTQEIVLLRAQLDQKCLEQVELQALESQNRLLRREKGLLQQEIEDLHQALDTLSQRPIDELSQQLQSKNLVIARLESELVEMQQTHQRLEQAHKFQTRQLQQTGDHKDKLLEQNELLQQQIASLQHQNEQLHMENQVHTLRLRWYMEPQDRQVMEAMGQTLRQMQLDQRLQKCQQNERPAGTDAQQVQAHSMTPSIGTATSSSLNGIKHQDSDTELLNLLRDEYALQRDQMRLVHQQKCFRLQKTINSQRQQLETLTQQLTKLQNEKNTLIQATETRKAWLTTRHMPVDGSKTGCTSHVSHPPQDTKETIETAAFSSNLLEICFDSIELDRQVTVQTSPRECFLFCDYFDYETQMSQVFSLLEPSPSSSMHRKAKLHFSVTFKFVPSMAFFSQPLSHVMQIELHQVQNVPQRSDCVAKASLSLWSLFLSSKGHQRIRVDLHSTHSHQSTVAKLYARLCLQQPVDRIFESCLQLDQETHRSQRAKCLEQRLAMATSDFHNPIDASESLTIKVHVIALSLRQPSKLSSSGQWGLRYRFMGYPGIRIPIHLENGRPVLLSHKRGFDFPNRRESLEILRKITFKMHLCFQKESMEDEHEPETTLAAVDVPLKWLVQGLEGPPCHYHHQMLCALKLSSVESPAVEFGIVSLELSIQRGEPALTTELNQIPAEWKESLKQQLAALSRRWSNSSGSQQQLLNDSLVVEPSKLQLVMELPIHIRLVRQLLVERMRNAKLGATRLHGELQRWQTGQLELTADWFGHQRNLEVFLQQALISLNADELELVWTILTSSLEQRRTWMEIICATCCTEWLQLEQQREYLDAFAAELRAFVADTSSKRMHQVPWSDFELRFFS